MKLTIEASYHNLKQVTTFEGKVEEYQATFGKDANPAKIREAIQKHLQKMSKQLNGKLDLSMYEEDEDNED